MKNTKQIILLLLISIVLASCKYDEGPMISFRTVENRVSQEFQLVEFSQNGIDCTQELIDSLGEIWVFLDKRKQVNLYNNLQIHNLNNRSYGAEYELSSNKQSITIKILGGVSVSYTGEAPFKINCTNIWEIKRLTKNDMWLECEEDNNIYYIKFEKR